MGISIRPFHADDAEAIAVLTLAAIRVTGLRTYSPEQIAAWSARHPGPQRFLDRAAGGAMILVAVDADDLPIAYALTEPDGHLDMLYCHPDHTGRGLGLAMLAEAEAVARTMGITRLFTEASELARPVFERAGYTLLHRRDFRIGPDDAPVAIHNFAMAKVLA